MASSLETVLQVLACPDCGHSSWKCEGAWATTFIQTERAQLRCHNCRRCYPVEDGVVDFVLGPQTITPFQRLMQFPPVVALYENHWRRLGYRIASSRSFVKDLETIVRWVAPERRVLTADLACGPGVFTRRLAARSPGVVLGIDISRPMLRRARHLSLQEGLTRVVYVRASAFELPVVSSCLDSLCCCGALHLFEDSARALGEMYRVLKGGQEIVCQTTIRPAFSAGMAMLLARVMRFGFFELPELVALLRAHGFELRQQERHRISFIFRAQKMRLAA